MKEKRDSYAYFWVAGAFATSEITALMAMSPTESREKGDTIPSRPDKVWDASTWKIHSPLPPEEVFMDAHLTALLEVLEQKKKTIEQLQDRFDTGINCVGVYTNSNPGFHMDKELIQRLAKLNLSVDFDLYCYCDHEENEIEV